MRLSGAIALVTGSGGAMGSAIARSLSAAGATVISLDVDDGAATRTAHLIEEAGGSAVVMNADVTSASAVDGALAQVTSRFGPVDVLVNNAGIFRSVGPLWEADPATWWRDVTVNLFGPFICSRAVLPSMIERNRGIIINLSGGGFGSPLPGGSGYTSSKAALIRMTETLAMEVGRFVSDRDVPGLQRDVFVYGVEPAFIVSSMNVGVATSDAGKRWLPFVAKALESNEVSDPGQVGSALCTLIELSPPLLSGLTFSYRDDFEALSARSTDLRSTGLYRLAYSHPPQP